MEDIRRLSLEELKEAITEKGEKAFRAKQVFEWLWKKNAHSFDDMSNISKSLRALLDEHFEIKPAKADSFQESSDGTTKIAFRMHDDTYVEGVLIPSGNRATACISCQVGCKLGCDFCATAGLGFKRDLTAGEIYDQIFYIKTLAEERGYNFGNIVYMGMGEPLLNYYEVMRSIDFVTGTYGLEMSARRITVSTSGIPHMIKRLGNDEVRFNLAVSLHSAIDEIRNTIMPINRKHNLEELSESIIYFVEKTDSRPTFEYLLLKDVNDSIDDAKALAEFCKSFPVKINIIEYNPTDKDKFQKSPAERFDAFTKFLESKNIIVNVRRSRGKDIDAACGQLANKKK